MRALSSLCLIFVFSAALFLCGGARAEFVTHHSMPASAFQSHFDQYVAQGYRLAHVDVYQTGAGIRYAAIWDRAGGTAWVARSGLDSGSYQSYFNQYTGQGYRPIDISATAAGSGTGTFAAIWDQSGGSFVARHNLNASQFQSNFDNFVAQGYMLVDVEGYTGQGGTLYAGLWVQSNGNGWYAHTGLSVSGFQQRFDQYVGQGYRLTHVDGYWTPSGVQYAGIWERTGGGAWVAHHNMTASQYQSLFNQYVGQGYELVHVSGFWDGSQERYAAIWSQ